MRRSLLAGLVFLFMSCPIALADGPDGAALFQQKCAMCHDHPEGRIPSHDVIASLPLDAVVNTMTSGAMQTQAAGLTVDEIRAIAAFLTGKTPSGPVQANIGPPAATAAVSNPGASLDANRCTDTPAPIRLDGAGWNGWGRDLENTRYQPQPGIKAEDVPKLKVKWTFAYPGLLTQGQPTIIGDRLFVASESGTIFSLNARTGCTYWAYVADVGVRTAMTVGPMPASSPAKFAVYFGDMHTSAYALDAESGKLIWKIRLDENPFARITGAPTLYKNRLYVPVSSEEETAGPNTKYECCTFRGSVAALDAFTGKIIWRTYPIQETPKPFKKNSAGTQMYGPAGASIWSSPTLDLKRKVVYVGTGDSYTDVETGSSDAIVAMDMKTGAIKWINQVTTRDNYVVGCRAPGFANCPSPVGPDYDFGSSTILHRLPNGKQVILAGQKSGILYGLDPDHRGKTLWKVGVGPGTALGGIEWGFAADPNAVYVPISNPGGRGEKRSSLSALKPETGEVIWHTPSPEAVCGWGTRGCVGAQSAAITVIPGIVLSGSMDGHLRAYSVKDGSIVWDFDTAATKYDAVNGVSAMGGSVDQGGPTVANGILYTNSGYGRIIGHRGNALIAFTVDGK
ncbi:MAG TPA: PQQ-binding-like beta-propeller repeat protein [Candidatus Acidoferrales bacterium]|nr:PQQ-binding-like beta-propeller repeat protein [Candidatus Acidoferrales bacterium]